MSLGTWIGVFAYDDREISYTVSLVLATLYYLNYGNLR